MEKIITKAIEGGYKASEISQATIFFVHENGIDGKRDCLCIDHTYDDQYGKRIGDTNHYTSEQIVLDPLFWQSLGKACGWQRDIHGEGFWLDNALEFQKINLTEGLDKAVDWLINLIN